MILKKYLFVLVIAIGSLCYGQEEIFSLGIDTEYNRTSKTTYSLPNIETNETAFLLKDDNEMHALFFDPNFNKISSFVLGSPKKKYGAPLGYAVEGKKFNLLYSNERLTDFFVLALDFDTNESTIIELDFNIKGELYIDTVTYKNQLYLFTSKDDDVFVREFSIDSNFKVVSQFTIDRSVIDQKINDKFLGLYKLTKKESSIVKMDYRVPIAIEQASSPNKLYLTDDAVIITIEGEDLGTFLYKVNLNSFHAQSNFYKYPEGKFDDFKRHNSFICDGKIFQIGTSKHEMTFIIKDMEGEELKEYYAFKDNPLEFKNGPIVQKGAKVLPFKNRKEFEETSKFLRKIRYGDNGLSVKKINGFYEVMIGSYTETSGPMILPGRAPNVSFSPNGQIIHDFNPIYTNYAFNKTSSATYMNTILNEDLDHIKAEKQVIIFDKIDEFTKDFIAISGDDIFYKNEIPYYAYYNHKTKTFNLLRF